MQERSAVLTRLEPTVRAALERLAEREQRSLGATVSVIVREYLERNAPAVPDPGARS